MKISQMPLSTTPSSDDVLAMLEGGTQNKKITFGAVAEWIANEEEIDNLNTDSKTIVGAVNELSDKNTELKNDLTEAQNDIEAAQGEIETLKDTAYIVNTASGDIAAFSDGAAADAKSLVVNIEPIQSGSGDPSPDNVRPISGRTGATVYRTGHNIWDEEYQTGYYDSSGIRQPAGNQLCTKNKISVIPSTTYHLTIGSSIVSTQIRTIEYDIDGNFLGRLYNIDSNWNFTTSADCYYININFSNDYGTVYNNDISVNYPSTFTDYEPYAGTTYPVSWETEAGTVYGGTIDVVSGKLTVDRAIVDMGTLNWGHQVGYFYEAIVGIKQTTTTSEYPHVICSSYKSVTQRVWANSKPCVSQISGDNTILVGDDTYSTAADFKAAVAGQTLCYILATPQTYQLTPRQIQTLLGDNVVRSDAGSVSVDYRADTKLYIEQLTKPTEDDMTANTAIQSGKFFMVGNRLFVATAAIASGDTINPGTNCTELSLADALNNLN